MEGEAAELAGNDELLAGLGGLIAGAGPPAGAGIFNPLLGHPPPTMPTGGAALSDNANLLAGVRTGRVLEGDQLENYAKKVAMMTPEIMSLFEKFLKENAKKDETAKDDEVGSEKSL